MALNAAWDRDGFCGLRVALSKLSGAGRQQAAQLLAYCADRGPKILPVGACGVVHTPRFNGKQE